MVLQIDVETIKCISGFIAGVCDCSEDEEWLYLCDNCNANGECKELQKGEKDV